MKPYQFYGVDLFPKPTSMTSIQSRLQRVFWGEPEEIDTEITVEALEYEGSFHLLRIKSEVERHASGFIKALVDHRRERFNFDRYIQPVDFAAYYDPDRQLVLFQAPKDVCRGVFLNLRESTSDVSLAEYQVDFAKVDQYCPEFEAVWFRKVSSRVTAACLSGSQIQSDPLFENLKREGELSSVTVPWPFNGTEHQVMITCRGAVVIKNIIRDDIGTELGLVMDVYDKLLSKVWERKEKEKQKTAAKTD